MNDNILRIENITKVYSKVKVLDNISMHVKRGEIYGLIGKNGSGKTTLLKIIGGLAFQTEGDIFLFNEKINSDLLERVGVLIEAPGIYPDMTAYQNMKLKCIYYGINKKGYIENLLEKVGLSDTGRKKTKKFSLGMKQRLAIALALVGEPDLLLLDEPVNGLDPQGIIEIREVLLKLSKENNITIIISSHILEELSKLVSRIGIINNKKIIEEISKEELLEKTKDKLEIVTDQVEKAVMVLEEELHIQNIKVIDEKTIYVYERLEDSGDINNTLLTSGIKIDSLSISRESLEDYFINMTGVEQHA